MIKIKISYERPEDLKWIMEKLGRDVKKIKAPKQQEGKFQKVYIEIKDCSIVKNMV